MKNFLSLCLLLLLSVPASIAKDMKFAQITDVKYNEKNSENIQKVVNEINKQKDIEFVVFTGDNISKPSKQDLKAFLKQVKKLNCPFYVVIGDKDVNKRKDLSKLQYSKFINKNVFGYKPKTPNYTFQKNGVVFVVLDGAKDVIPSTIGYYKEDAMIWLENILKEKQNKNVIIFQHFPVVPPFEKETYNTFKSEEYLQLISRYKNVKAVIAGHYGVNSEKNVDGVVHISTAPVPTYRVIDLVDYETNNPTIWADVRIAE